MSFLHSIDCLFTFFVLIFKVKKVLILNTSNLSIFFFCHSFFSFYTICIYHWWGKCIFEEMKYNWIEVLMIFGACSLLVILETNLTFILSTDDCISLLNRRSLLIPERTVMVKKRNASIKVWVMKSLTYYKTYYNCGKTDESKHKPRHK
jgi:hypothetical protein